MLIGATLNMWDKLEIESLVDSDITSLRLKILSNITVGRQFVSYKDHLDPRMTIHTLEYVRLPRGIPRSHIHIRGSLS